MSDKSRGYREGLLLELGVKSTAQNVRGASTQRNRGSILGLLLKMLLAESITSFVIHRVHDRSSRCRVINAGSDRIIIRPIFSESNK
jgi:hypothetical protein